MAHQDRSCHYFLRTMVTKMLIKSDQVHRVETQQITTKLMTETRNLTGQLQVQVRIRSSIQTSSFAQDLIIINQNSKINVMFRLLVNSDNGSSY